MSNLAKLIAEHVDSSMEWFQKELPVTVLRNMRKRTGKRTGALQRSVSATKNEDRSVELYFLTRGRFLDMGRIGPEPKAINESRYFDEVKKRKTKRTRKRKFYNKPVWSLFNTLVQKLTYGLTPQLAEALAKKIDNTKKR